MVCFSPVGYGVLSYILYILLGYYYNLELLSMLLYI